MPSATRNTNASSGSDGSTPAKPKTCSKKKIPVPSAAKNDRITEATSSTGASSERSRIARITSTTMSASGRTTKLSRVADSR